MIAALLLVWNLSQWWHDTNSHAANARGVTAFRQKKFTQAVKAFGDANAIAPTPQRAFNLGTAQIAAGNREEGSATLSKAMRDPALRADTLFNRGNSALASKAYDYAIKDFSDVLRLRPRDAGAKRNLEIALVRQRQQQQQQSSGTRQPQKGSSPQPQPQQSRSAPNEKQQGDANIESLLRSVQQQEQEELSRMHRAKGERLHVGW